MQNGFDALRAEIASGDEVGAPEDAGESFGRDGRPGLELRIQIVFLFQKQFQSFEFQSFKAIVRR
jgi:hypothetical protein